jgi:hypothetical protein
VLKAESDTIPQEESHVCTKTGDVWGMVRECFHSEQGENIFMQQTTGKESYQSGKHL